MRIAYVNGRYLPGAHAQVSIEDRGYQLSDGVYEVCEVRGGALVDERRHYQRLLRSLKEIEIVAPLSAGALGVVMREVVRRNRVRDGIVYLQVTRGVAPRDHAFPTATATPSVTITAKNLDIGAIAAAALKGVDVITLPETRWARVDIKSIALLPNVLAKQAARAQGAKEAWFVDATGRVTEGASSNAWIVEAGGKIITRPLANDILQGVTRTVLLDVIKSEGFSLEERAFTAAEAYAAHEAFLTSASQTVMPIVRIDGKTIGDGIPGPVAAALRRGYYKHVEIT